MQLIKKLISTSKHVKYPMVQCSTTSSKDKDIRNAYVCMYVYIKKYDLF